MTNLDTGQLRRVQVILEILRRAEQALRENTDASNGLAVSLLHDAVEHTLYLVILCKPPGTVSKREEFGQLVSACADIYNNETAEEMPYRRHLGNLNQTRVAFKHYGNAPNRATTIEVFENGREFLRLIYERLFGVSIDSFHPLDVLRTEVIRDNLRSAIQLAEAGQFQDAAVKAANANWYLDTAFARIFAMPQPPLSLGAPFRGISDVQRTLERAFKYIRESDTNTLITSIMIAAGLDVFEHTKLRQRLPIVHASINGIMSHSIMWPHPYVREDIDLCVGQIARVALWIEERFPTLQHDGKQWTL